MHGDIIKCTDSKSQSRAPHLILHGSDILKMMDSTLPGQKLCFAALHEIPEQLP